MVVEQQAVVWQALIVPFPSSPERRRVRGKNRLGALAAPSPLFGIPLIGSEVNQITRADCQGEVKPLALKGFCPGLSDCHGWQNAEKLPALSAARVFPHALLALMVSNRARKSSVSAAFIRDAAGAVSRPFRSSISAAGMGTAVAASGW